jgi:uncharacterized membrane protein
MWGRYSRQFAETLRRDFVAGLLVFVPIGFTVLGVLWIVEQLDALVLPRVFGFLGMEASQPPLVGAVATLALILLVGSLTRSFIGRTMLGLWERLVDRIPIARSLYTVLKQFMEAMFGTGSSSAQFSRVVIIEYPRVGIHSYAFVTGRVEQSYQELPDGLLKVFVPSTPNPTTGYFLLLREADTIETGLSVEEAFKLIISAGIASGEGAGAVPLIRGRPRVAPDIRPAGAEARAEPGGKGA